MPNPIPFASGERIAATTSRKYRPYSSRGARRLDATTWVQVDLGASRQIDEVLVYPTAEFYVAGDGFPVRFRIDMFEGPTDHEATTIVDHTREDFPAPGSNILRFDARGVHGRYLRFTATRLREPAPPLYDNESEKEAFESVHRPSFRLKLAKLSVLAAGVDVAQGCAVDVDGEFGDPGEAPQVVRAPRPAGEGLITDNPGNVTQRDSWRPQPDAVSVPTGGVTVRGPLFTRALERNAEYLLSSFGVSDMLRPFLLRSGAEAPAPERAPHGFWDDALPGSSAGRFLMGAANTLRWINNDELARRVDAVVSGIHETRQDDGYIMAYPVDTIFESERGAYTRSWVTHGLLEAATNGNDLARELLRGFYDWYNGFEGLPRVLRECGYGPQGTVANTRVALSDIGRPEDIQTVQRYLQEDYWIDDLAARRPEALWQYPYDRQHSYLLTCVEPYADLYRATGDPRYLHAVQGAWDMIVDHWQSPGGSIPLLEMFECPPGANPIFDARGETCASAFWIMLNQRLHRLFPDDERYVAQIEKSIYNVILPNQGGAEGIRYHTRLIGQLEAPMCENTCCEGQGTRLLGALPEFIYSLDQNGVWVNLFEASSIEAEVGGSRLTLDLVTRFPDDPAVGITVSVERPTDATIRVRVPSWAAHGMTISLNGEPIVVGTPGSYAKLTRRWEDGDTISFVLPATVRQTRYRGADDIPARPRYIFEYGPVLLAALGGDSPVLWPWEDEGQSGAPQTLRTETAQLGFRLLLLNYFRRAIDLKPYYALDTEHFSAVPMIIPAQRH